jgi:polysaccharide biosynthesis/export protein
MRVVSKLRGFQYCVAVATLGISSAWAQPPAQNPVSSAAINHAQDAGAMAKPAPVQKAMAESVSRAGDSALRLGPGDLVQVSVYNIPELDTKIRISNNGDINLPLIDYVHVAGLTIDEAEDTIERRLDKGGFVKDPHVQVFVQEYISQGVNVLGEVVKPGIYSALGDQKLFTLVSAAGGFTDRAGNSITVTHRGQPPISVPMSRNLEDHPESNIAVLPGDTVIVRRADVVYVVGDVMRPSGLMMDSGHISVLQAIALAGGTTSTAKLNGARIVRKGPAGLTTIPVSLKKLMQAKTNDISMEADDILFVPTSSRKVLQARTAEAAVQLATSAGIVFVRP